MDAAVVTKLLAMLDREIWLVTACFGSRRGGLIATSVGSASIVPHLPRMTLGLSRQHFTYDLVDASRSFALHLLGEDHLEWVWRFGLQSARDLDKLEGLTTQKGMTGCPLLPEALGWLECRVEGRLNMGDRSIYLGEVVDAGQNSSAPVLTQKRLWQLAPAEKRQRLEEFLASDQAADAEAIGVWRQMTAH